VVGWSGMTTKDKAAETFKTPDDDDEANDGSWESNRDDENPEHLPWPEENESKE
jgi:hypothetical protein